MPEKSEFDQMRADMEERKKAAMAASENLKEEVGEAIQKLRSPELSDEEGKALVERFSELNRIPSVGQEEVKALIQGFEQANVNVEPAPALDNLNRILDLKHNERYEYEHQSRR